MKSKIHRITVGLLIAVSVAGLLCGCSTNPEYTAKSSSIKQNITSNSVTVQSTPSKRVESASEESPAESGKEDRPAEPESTFPQETDEPADDPQTEIPASFTAGSIETAQLGKLQYWLYMPSNPTENMPLIIYLHGGSEKGDDLNLITDADGFPQYLQNGQLGDVRAYVIMPQLPSSQKSWESIAGSISELIDYMAKAYTVDRNNVSLTGHSMGGTGVWHLACMYPALFSRIAPLSGSIRTTPEAIDKLKAIPIRTFVGSADSIVAPESSEEMIAALKAAGGNAEITVFDGADHFSVPRLAYLDANVGLIDWLIGN